MNSMRIVVPALPPRECNPNRPYHWSQRYRAGQDFKNEVYCCCYQVRRELEGKGQWQPFNKATLELTFIFPTNRRRDEDNLRAQFKPGQDALVTAHLLVDDDTDHLKPGKMTILVDKNRAPMTIIQLTELDEQC